MEPLLDESQQSYQQSLRKFFEKEWPAERLRAAMRGPTAIEREVWRRLAHELGAAGLNIPEVLGGSGGAPAESLLVSEEAGRALFGPVYLGTVVLAANAVMLSGDDDVQAELLPGIADGSITATLAWTGPGRDRSRGSAPTATRQERGWTLRGQVRRVLDGATADRVLVVADAGGEETLFLLEGEQGMTRVEADPLDPTRRLGTLTFEAAPARVVGRIGGAAAILSELHPILALHLAAEAVGGAATCVAQTVAYVATREQFGQPVGSFQAVKHRCADMQVRLEGARAGMRTAGRALAAGEPDLDLVASVLKIYATRSYFRSAADMIQLHGGIGFTWEHTAHLHFKRAKSLELLGGSHEEHREVIARRVLDREAS